MSTVIFSFNGNETKIQCTKENKMKEIIDRFKQKSNINSNEDIFFLYGGNKINLELSFYEQANNLDKTRNEMYIIVYNMNEKTQNDEGLIKSSDIICPLCKQNCLIDLKDYKIKLYDCKNDHEISNILINEFDNTQKINENEIKCKNCERTKFKSYNRLFYICAECKIYLCPLCKEKHNKEHEIIDYNNIKCICLEHNDYFISYCQECKINLCMNCENKHDNKHKIINYKNILPDNNIKEELQAFRKRLDKLNNDITEIKNRLTKVSENMEIYYKLIYDMIYNYNTKQKYYEILKNLDSIKDFINLPEIDKITCSNDYSEKFDILINIYNKMNNINIKPNKENKNDKSEPKGEKIIENINSIKENEPKPKEENSIENINFIKENNNSNIKQDDNEKIIECKTLKKTILNGQKVVIKIDETKVLQPLFGSKYLLYKIQTEPFGWIVYRKLNDFDDLRKLITKYFPEFYVPFLKRKNEDKMIDESTEKKQINYLILFLDKLVQNESFKTSEVLLAFLSYKDRNKYELTIKEYTKKPKEINKVEEYETIDGKAKIGNIEKNEKYMNNINKYFKIHCELLTSNNNHFKNYLTNMSKIDENLNEIKKYFEVGYILNTKVLMKPTITKSFNELSRFFTNFKKILLKFNEIFECHFKKFYKFINLEGQAFKELIERREKLKEKYLIEEKKLYESKLNNTVDIEKINNNVLIFKNQLGYADSILMKELRKIINEYCISYVENIKQFNSEYYPLINDQIGTWSDLQNYVMSEKSKKTK